MTTWRAESACSTAASKQLRLSRNCSQPQKGLPATICSSSWDSLVQVCCRRFGNYAAATWDGRRRRALSSPWTMIMTPMVRVDRPQLFCQANSFFTAASLCAGALRAVSVRLKLYPKHLGEVLAQAVAGPSLHTHPNLLVNLGWSYLGFSDCCCNLTGHPACVSHCRRRVGTMQPAKAHPHSTAGHYMSIGCHVAKMPESN